MEWPIRKHSVRSQPSSDTPRCIILTVTPDCPLSSTRQCNTHPRHLDYTLLEKAFINQTPSPVCVCALMLPLCTHSHMPIFALLPLDEDGGWCESTRAKRKRRIKGRIRGYGAAVMRPSLIYIQSVFWSGCESMGLWACPSGWTRNPKTQKGESRPVDLYRRTESLPGSKSPETDGRTDSLFWGFSLR